MSLLQQSTQSNVHNNVRFSWGFLIVLGVSQEAIDLAMVLIRFSMKKKNHQTNCL